VKDKIVTYPEEMYCTLHFRRKNRRTSSDNVSTPASCSRSRSPSLLSSDEYCAIAEEEASTANTAGAAKVTLSIIPV